MYTNFPQTSVIYLFVYFLSDAVDEPLPIPEETAQPLGLFLGPSLSHEAFERHWLDLDVVHSEALGLQELPSSPEMLQAALQLVKIQTLAFSRENTKPWKAYLYTHGSGTLILAELLQDEAETGDDSAGLRVSLKQLPENESAIQEFMSVLRTVLQTLTKDGS